MKQGRARRANPQQAATIYEVAQEAGVSISTVSRVLNNPSKVNEHTRKTVLEVMEKLAFVPKAEAIARARKHLYRIGVLTPFFTEASFMQRIRGISGFMNPGAFEVIIYTVKSREQLEEYLDLLPFGKRLDGMIILSLTIPKEAQERLKKSQLPTVFVETSLRDFSSVAIDNYQGGRIAAEHLISRGYTRLGFVGEYSAASFTLAATEQRLDGFRAKLREAELDLEERFIRTAEFSEHSVEKWIEDLIEQDVRPDAVFAASDIIAAKIIKQASIHGLRVPRDLAVLGFDDLDMAEYLNLTTINQNLEASGRLAAEILSKKIADPAEPARKTILELSVVKRGTC